MYIGWAVQNMTYDFEISCHHSCEFHSVSNVTLVIWQSATFSIIFLVLVHWTLGQDTCTLCLQWDQICEYKRQSLFPTNNSLESDILKICTARFRLSRTCLCCLISQTFLVCPLTKQVPEVSLTFCCYI